MKTSTKRKKRKEFRFRKKTIRRRTREKWRLVRRKRT